MEEVSVLLQCLRYLVAVCVCVCGRLCRSTVPTNLTPIPYFTRSHPRRRSVKRSLHLSVPRQP